MEIIIEYVVNELKGIFFEDWVVINMIVWELYSKDEFYYVSSLFDVVVFLKMIEEVSMIMKIVS